MEVYAFLDQASQKDTPFGQAFHRKIMTFAPEFLEEYRLILDSDLYKDLLMEKLKVNNGKQQEDPPINTKCNKCAYLCC
jgi:hypothetical protein